jgi:starch-binding outer membrane protein, SusD/RagB family
MKTKIYSKVVVALIALVAFSSCNDLFNVSDIKKNPNAPQIDQVTITPLTTGTLVGLGNLHEDTDTRIAFMWAGQLAGQSRQHAGFQNYTVAASTFSWANYYNVLKNARLIRDKATVINNKLSVGVSQVIEAMVMLKLTSLYGDAPYSEALDDVAHPTPKYDGQIALYNTLIALLNTAYANLNSKVGSITGDFIYHGSSAKWAAAAKSLQARMYLHLKDYPNAIASAAGGISSSANDMYMIHGVSQAVDFNMNYDFFDQARPGDTSFDPPAFLPVFMCTDITTGISTTDIAKRNAKTDETGLYFHYFQYAAESDSGLDPNTIDGMFISTAPHPLLTYYETQLIIAEANARLSTPNITDAVIALNNVRAGLAKGDINGLTTNYPLLGMTGKITCATSSTAVVGASTKFTKEFQVNSQMIDSVGTYIGTVFAITDDTHLTLGANAAVNIPKNRKYQRNALVYLGYQPTDFNSGGIANPLTGPNAGRTQQQALLYEIASQKFVVMLAQYEVFNELRRLQVATPAIGLAIPINIGTKYPARFIYPQNEVNTNPNVPKVSGSVPDQFVKLPIFQ